MAGMSDTTMEPETTLSREMFFTMFAQAMGIEREDTMEKDFADEARSPIGLRLHQCFGEPWLYLWYHRYHSGARR